MKQENQQNGFILSYWWEGKERQLLLIRKAKMGTKNNTQSTSCHLSGKTPWKMLLRLGSFAFMLHQENWQTEKLDRHSLVGYQVKVGGLTVSCRLYWAPVYVSETCQLHFDGNLANISIWADRLWFGCKSSNKKLRICPRKNHYFWTTV